MKTFDFEKFRRLVAGLAAAGLLSVALAGGVVAQDEAVSGNGGTSGSDASGGGLTVGIPDEAESEESTEDEATDEVIVGDLVAEGLFTLGDDIAATVIEAIMGDDEAATEEEAPAEDTVVAES